MIVYHAPLKDISSVIKQGHAPMKCQLSPLPLPDQPPIQTIAPAKLFHSHINALQIVSTALKMKV